MKKRDELFAALGLVIVALLWGYGFVALKRCENIPANFLNSVRFLIASCALSIVFFKKLKKLNKKLLCFGALCGVLIFCCYTSATYGIRLTSASRNAFFTCLEAPVVPFLNYLAFRKVPGKKNFVCVVICVIGVFLISVSSSESLGLNIGDIISLFASLFLAIEIIIINRYAKDLDPIALTIVQMFVIFLLSLVMFFVLGEPLPDSLGGIEILDVIYLGLFASGTAFVLQTISLKHISSNKSSIILTLEPVLGAIFCAIFLGDYLGLRGYIGGALIFVGILISESDIFRKETPGVGNINSEYN